MLCGSGGTVVRLALTHVALPPVQLQPTAHAKLAAPFKAFRCRLACAMTPR